MMKFKSLNLLVTGAIEEYFAKRVWISKVYFGFEKTKKPAGKIQRAK